MDETNQETEKGDTEDAVAFESDACQENFLDDVLDITEDDVDARSDKGSETDSGSYWSAVDEDEDIFLDSQETATVTAECVTSEVVQTAEIKEYEYETPVEGKLVQLESNAVESLFDDKEIEVIEVEANIIDREIEVIEVETSITNSDLKLKQNEDYPSQKRTSELQAIEEDSAFGNFHNRIAEKLEEKTSSPTFRVKGTDTVDSDSYKPQTQQAEKCIETYDIIDQFDVKVSERDEYRSAQMFNVSRFHSFAAGLRRTLSLRKSRGHEFSGDVRNENAKGLHVRSGTWPPNRSSPHDFIEVSCSKRKDENGEIMEVLVVNPNITKSGKENIIDKNDKVDNNPGMNNTNGSVLQGPNDVDIGNTDDLNQPMVPKTIKKLHDDIDVISLSGFDNADRKILGINVENTKADHHTLSADDNNDDDDVFGHDIPVRPPRKKKEQFASNQDSSSKRTASDSEIGKEIANAPEERKKRHTLQAPPGTHSAFSKGSKSEENIFKGILPFLDIDPKKRTLTGSGDKYVPPNKEQLQLFTDAFPPQIPEFPQDRRSLIALEVYTTERTYVRGLELLVKLFKQKALKAGLLDNKEAETIFSNVNQIVDFNKGILDELYRRISDWSDERMIGDIFVANASEFKFYATYCQNYDASEAFVKQKIKKKKDFETFLQSCYGNPSCQLGLTLPSYLITVVQRTPRYILLLKDLLRKTPVAHPDYKNLKQGQEEMEKIANFINNQLKQSQSEKALAALQQQIIGLKAYYFSGRTLVHEGPVCLMNIKRTYQCVLFNDLLVFAVKGDSKQSEVELVLDLSVVWFEDLMDLDPQTTKRDAIGLYTPDRPYTIYVGTQGEKKIWLQNMKKAINNHILGLEASADANLDKRSANHTYANSCVYSGEYLESKRHGQGTMMWPNQMTYRGQWVDDERNGTGVLEYGSGDIYDGEWKNDRQYGNGVCKYRSGDKITCEWKIGIRHGKATIEFANGDAFEGSFKNDRIEGEGTLTCKNGSHYSGSWKRNMKNGYGVLKMQNGDAYRGEFKWNLFHGNGEFIYSDGSVYKGEFEEGQRHGQGTYSQDNGNVYEGNWMNDNKEGHGKLTFSNGDVYDGTFMQDKRSGNGTITYKDGGQYKGQWENDTITGRGLMEYKNGDIYDGQWKACQRHGKGKLTVSCGVVYEGDWQYDVYHGKGTLERSSGWKYKGDFLNGKRHGNGTLTDPINEYKFQGEWKNDKKEGNGIEMIRGTLYDGNFKNNKRDGRGVETSQDTTTYEGCWRIGQKHGKGVRKLLNGMVQPQVWHMGCLMECPAVVSRDIPPLERF